MVSSMQARRARTEEAEARHLGAHHATRRGAGVDANADLRVIKSLNIRCYPINRNATQHAVLAQCTRQLQSMRAGVCGRATVAP